MIAPSRGRVFAATETFANPRREPEALLRAEGFDVRVNPFNRRLTRADYPECFDGVQYVIAGLEPYDLEVFERFPQIRVISRIGIGVDAIDLQGARARGVAVYNTPAAPSRSVAELTIGLIVSLARGVVWMHSDFHGGRWQPRLGRELEALTVGLVGFGRIGRMVAERLIPFGCRLLACDPRFGQLPPPPPEVTVVALDELLASADVVSLHLPLEPETRGLFDGPRLDRMKPGALLVNTSRGRIVDDKALIDRLRIGRLGGAALDVFEAEPDTAPYAGVPNLLVTPHVGSHTVESRYRMEMGAVKNILAYVEAVERCEAPPEGPWP